MTETASASLHDILIRANRVLNILESIDTGERHPGLIILEGREVYSQMLLLLGKKRLTANEAAVLQSVVDRLQDSLQFFGDRR